MAMKWKQWCAKLGMQKAIVSASKHEFVEMIDNHFARGQMEVGDSRINLNLRRSAQFLSIRHYRLVPGFFVSLLAVALSFSLTVRADTPPTGRWEPIIEIWDEFNGAQVDLKKWVNEPNKYIPNSGMKPYNAQLEKGELNIYTRMEKISGTSTDQTITSGEISSKTMVKFGYFEVRAKVQKSKVNCAFWLYRWTETATFEIDIFEIAGATVGSETSLNSNAHVYYGPPEKENDQNRVSDPQVWKASAPLANDYHVYGFEWDEKELKWYLDGKLVRTKANTDWQIPMTIIIGAGVMPNWRGVPEARELPYSFKVDYFRAWRKIPGKSSAETNQALRVDVKG